MTTPKKIMVIDLFKNYLFTHFKYPQGELQVRLTEQGIKQAKEADKFVVVADIKSSEDIIKLILLRSALLPFIKSNGGYDYYSSIKLILPYLPYGRADRRFVEGDCEGLATFMYLLQGAFPLIYTLDAHNPLVLRGNYIDMSAVPYINKAIVDFAGNNNRIVVLFPDKGAKERYKAVDTLACNVDSIEVIKLHCEKQRDPETSKFLGFTVPTKEQFPEGVPVLIIDDICDGGGTFLGIAKAVEEYKLNLGLYVTHGIFSQGLEKLTKAFDKIYTTDSLHRDSEELLKVYNALPDMITKASL